MASVQYLRVVRFEHTLVKYVSLLWLVPMPPCLLGVLFPRCAGNAERQRPHRFSTWCDETEIRLKSDLVSSFDAH